MAISVNWPTKVINVPKADLTLIQASPVEIRELDLNAFHRTLRSLEDDPDGIGFVKTHLHNTEVTLSGLTYARIIEIINGYTVEFEDGQYTVNCTGANHNLGDVKVANQVSLIINNAAGLITNTAIEYASYNGGVTVDQTSSYTGTLFPVGTPQRPVNNFADAILIASTRGFTTFYISGDATVDDSNDFRGMIFIGESQTKTELDIDTNAQVDGCEFYDATVTGTLDGDSKIKNCTIGTLNYVNGIIEQCLLEIGTITLGGSAEAHFLDCWSGVAGSNTPTIDMGGSGQDLSLRNYNGGIKIENKTGSNAVSIDLNSGHIILDSTVTGGEVVIRGIGKLTDNSTGGTINIQDFLNPGTITEEIWNDPMPSRILGLTQENYLLDQCDYYLINNVSLMTGGRIRIYSNPASIGGTSDVIATYTISATYDGNGNLTSYGVEKQ
ncbi:MAG: hypothetical protein ACYTEU_06920 [Planctomycetota bacterium]|jgi:hypothetical protein